MIGQGTFKRVNPHPQGLRVGDCVKRACCLASEINYHDIGIMLNRFKKETHSKNYNDKTNDKPFIQKVLLGVDLGKMQYANQGHRFLVKEMAYYRKSKAIVQVAGHLVCIDGKGSYLDTWDSGEKSIYKAWGIPSYETIVAHIKKNYPKLCKGLSLERTIYE